ncbi:MAG: flavin reductase family protein [Nitrospinales bacterium]
MTVHTEFQTIRPREQYWVDIYHLMNSIIQPRPIAWISTVSENGIYNLAPFSYFNICSMNPPIISNSIFYNRDGSEKDTLRNIKSNGKYVVGAVGINSAEKANVSSAPFAPDADEFKKAQVPFVDCGANEPRLVAESPVQLKCTLNQLIKLGNGAGVGTLVLGDVNEILISRKLNHPQWQKGIPPDRMNNVGRMGADYYAKTTDLFQMPRPVIKK